MLAHIPMPGLGVALPAYATLYAIAAAFAVVVGPRWIAALAGTPVGRTRRTLLLLLVVGLLGARLLFVIRNWAAFAAAPWRALYFWAGGRHEAGAIAALVGVGPPVCRWQGIPVRRCADAGVSTFFVFVAIARIGCLLHGCCYGSLCEWPWCVPHGPGTSVYVQQRAAALIPAGAAQSLPVHLLPLYRSGFALLCAGLSVWVFRRRRYDGQTALVMAAIGLVGMATLERLRAHLPTDAAGARIAGLREIADTFAVVAVLMLVTVETLRIRGGRRMRTAAASAAG
jgi:phosphatidylglycerol:prolipoprotein diacylglycerol transferase